MQFLESLKALLDSLAAKLRERKPVQPVSTATTPVPAITVERGPEVVPAFRVQELYVNSEIGLRVRSAPEIKDGNQIDTLALGTKVLVRGEQGKWFNVQYDGKQGWVSSAYLSETKPPAPEAREEASADLPQFRIGIANMANDSNTIKLRKIIKDEFGGGKNGWELQCTEYVQYRAARMGIVIRWPADRPRHGGRWAAIFERNGIYKILTEPKAGCAMSFTTGFRTPAMNETGHVAFVEQVLLDGSVKVSEANWPSMGKYNERVLPPAEWRDKYRCRFIDFRTS